MAIGRLELLSQLSAVSNISTVQVKKTSRPTILEFLYFTVCGLKSFLSKYILWQTATTEACERTSSCILFVCSVAESPGGKQTHSSPSTLCGCFTTYNFADATLLPFILSRCEFEYQCVWAALVSLPEGQVRRLPEDRVARSAPGCLCHPVWYRWWWHEVET